MAYGDILVDGKSPPAISGKEMCEYVISSGLWHGTPEGLWNHDAGGHLITPHELYWKAMHIKGHLVEYEQTDGSRTPMFQSLTTN